MTRLTTVILILVLPALVAAAVNRLQTSPGLERPDDLTWNMQRHEPGPVVMRQSPSAWDGVCLLRATGCCRSGVACLGPACQQVTRLQLQPDRREEANAPVLWPHAPRMDEQETVARELRAERVPAQGPQPAD